MLVERGDDLLVRDVRGASASALQPLPHARPGDQANGFPAEQLGHADAVLRRPSHELGIDLIVDIADLDRLGHALSVSCALA